SPLEPSTGEDGCAKWGVADATHGAYRRWVDGLKSMATIGCRYRDTIIHALRVAAPGDHEDGRTLTMWPIPRFGQ
ncbi:MAG: hypothetical protein ACREIC_16220, partial [Limisphaerales bacterium]